MVSLSLPSGVTLKSGDTTQVISTILGGTGGSGESKGISWILSFGNSVANSSIDISVTSSNAGDKSISVPVIVTAVKQTSQTTITGGGGGGGGSACNVAEIPKILAGSSYVATFDEECVPDVASIEIVATLDQFYTKITVDTYDEKPRWVVFDAAPHKINRYLRIKYSKPNTYIEKAYITFKVNETWLKDNNIDPASVVMYRLSDTKEWEKLTTVVNRREGGYIYYTAETPGFSWFAISAQENSGFRDIFAKAEEVEPTPAPAPEEKPIATTPPETKPPLETSKPKAVKPTPAPEMEMPKKEKRGICGPSILAVISATPLLLKRKVLKFNF